jgi:hypothetical protein
VYASFLAFVLSRNDPLGSRAEKMNLGFAVVEVGWRRQQLNSDLPGQMENAFHDGVFVARTQ